MYASSVSSNEGISISAKVKNMVHASKPDIKIVLDGEKAPNSILTYSNLDKISGTVAITCSHETLLEALEINFVGMCHSITGP